MEGVAIGRVARRRTWEKRRLVNFMRRGGGSVFDTVLEVLLGVLGGFVLARVSGQVVCMETVWVDELSAGGGLKNLRGVRS